MKRIFIFLSIFTAYFSLNAQHLSDLSFGTDSTFEVMTWNIEHFPKDGTATTDSVIKIIKALHVDVIAFQEINDTSAFKKLADALPDYNCLFTKTYSQDLAYLYNKNTVTVNKYFQIYTESYYWSPFPRAPQVLDMTYDNKNIIIINNHLKAFGDSESQSRRLKANQLLVNYVNAYQANKSVIVLGDMNDEITDAEADNVFEPILEDPKDFKFADWNIATGSSSNWSYPAWPSDLDHIWVTNELFDELEEPIAKVETIKIDDYLSGGYNTYDNIISDHRPVAMKIVPNNFVGINKISAESSSLKNYPNPFSQNTEFVFDKFYKNMKLKIYDSNGKMITKLDIPKESHTIDWKTGNLTPGIYFAVLLSDNKIISRKVLIKE